MQFPMTGRLDHIEKHQDSFFHIITTPAKDAYSKPNSFKVRSQTQLGSVGQEVHLTITVTGNVYDKKYLKNGVQQVFKEANVYLEGALSRKGA